MGRVQGLRRSVLKGKNKSRNRGTGWRGTWQDRLDIPKAQATPVLLTRGEYPMKGKEAEEIKTDDNPEPMAHFHTCLTHGFKLKPKGPGSYFSARCNIDAGDEDCMGCYARDTGDRRVNGKYTYSFNVLHLAIHELVKKRDRDNKVICYEQDSKKHKRGDPVLTWREVTRPRDLKDIREDLEELLEVGLEGEEGGIRLVRKKYIEVGAGFRDQLVDIDAQAEKMCICGGDLEPMAFSCEECEEEIIDVAEENMDAEEIEKYGKERQRCPHCGFVGIPVPDPECSECDEPQPLDFTQVVAWIRKKGENTNSHIVVERVERLDEFELEDGTSMIEWEEDEDGDEIPAEDDDGNWNWIFTEDHEIRKMAEVGWNFEKVHAPRDHEYIASRIGATVPRDFEPSTHAFGAGSGRATSKYRKYGKDGGSRTRIDDEDEEEKKKSSRRGRRSRRSRDEDEDNGKSRGRTRSRRRRGRR